MKKLAIIGSGDLGQQIAHHAQSTAQYETVAFFDDFESEGTLKNTIPVWGKTGDILSHFEIGKFDVLMIAVGYKHFEVRKRLFENFEGKIPFATIIHPSCYVDSTVSVGEGSILYPGCILDMNAEIGKNVLVYTGCIISHDSSVGKHSILSPGVKIAGFSHIGSEVNLGTGTVVIDNLNITSKTSTGAGAVVVKNIETAGLYIGCPAKIKNK